MDIKQRAGPRVREGLARMKNAAVLGRKPARFVVIVTGSRSWTDERSMNRRLCRYPQGTLVIHGGAKGADMIADEIASDLGFRILVEPYFSDSGNLGGPLRNELLIDLGCTYARHGYLVTVEAFPLQGCTGTLDCMRRAHNAGLRVERA